MPLPTANGINDIPYHQHDGKDGSPQINPQNLLALPYLTALPDITLAPAIFIYESGATKRLYVKHGATFYYATLT